MAFVHAVLHEPHPSGHIHADHKASVADIADPGKSLHPVQDSGDHCLNFFWPHGRPWWRDRANRSSRAFRLVDRYRSNLHDFADTHGDSLRRNPPSPAITSAAERYLEQYGDPLVMNTYLKIALLVLAAICLMLGLLIFRSQKALANIHPLVIRIDDVGHAEAVVGKCAKQESVGHRLGRPTQRQIHP